MIENNPKDEKATLKLVEKKKSAYKKYRKQFEKAWIEYEDGYYGRIWKYTDGYRPYENTLFQLVESELPILTDSMAIPSAKVDDPSYLEQAKNLGNALEWVFNDQDFQTKQVDAYRKTLMSGPAWYHVYYDLNADNGDGQEIIEVLDWRQVYLDGSVMDIKACPGASIDLIRKRSWLVLNYPKYAEQIEKIKEEDIKSDYDYYNTDSGREKYDTGSYANRERPLPYQDEDTLVMNKTFIQDFSLESIPQEETQEELQEEAQTLNNGESPDVNKWQDHDAHMQFHYAQRAEIMAQLGLPPEASYEDAEMVVDQVLQESPDAGVDTFLFQIKILDMHNEEHEEMKKVNPSGKRLKYPNGLRQIETLGKLVLYDGKSKSKHNQIPLAPVYCYRNGTIYGDGEIRNLIDSQRMQAIMAYKEYKGLQRVANPEKHVSASANLTKEDISNEDGAIYILPDDAYINNVSPGNISPQLGQFAQTRIETMRQISGINEQSQGESPHPNQSGLAINKLQQQAIGRIRMKSRLQMDSLKRLGFLIASDIIQFWSNEKVLKLEDMGAESKQVIFNPIDYQDLKYEVVMAEGTMAGIDKDAFNAYMYGLLNNNRITFGQYLQVVDLPKTKKLQEFAAENDETQAQVQDLQSQLEQVKVENLKLKAQVSPEFLTMDERKALEEVKLQEDNEQLVNNTEVINGQSVN